MTDACRGTQKLYMQIEELIVTLTSNENLIPPMDYSMAEYENRGNRHMCELCMQIEGTGTYVGCNN